MSKNTRQEILVTVAALVGIAAVILVSEYTFLSTLAKYGWSL